jgi:hypothetical protein
MEVVLAVAKQRRAYEGEPGVLVAAAQILGNLCLSDSHPSQGQEACLPAANVYPYAEYHGFRSWPAAGNLLR